MQPEYVWQVILSLSGAPLACQVQPEVQIYMLGENKFKHGENSILEMITNAKVAETCYTKQMQYIFYIVVQCAAHSELSIPFPAQSLLNCLY